MDATSEPIRSEREQLIQDYLDGHVSRGGLLSDEVHAQAAAYAQRIAEGRAYEAQLKAHADKQRQMVEYATTDKALRERSNRKALANSYINRFAGENAKVTDEMKRSAELYAERVLAAADPLIEQRAVRTAAQRLEAGKRARTDLVIALRAELAAKAGSDHWRALREHTKLLRQALDDLDALLFREALRPTPQDAPQEPGDGSAVSARDDAPVGRTARSSRRR